ncbi:MAG TPA: efflux RND transporter periplasmic adaptor subunit [Rhodanobacteraceae bacterium]|nr:efflux RND transporter periplasmic adaptor subunit [Rhodanobacteraceae bacterium]
MKNDLRSRAFGIAVLALLAGVAGCSSHNGNADVSSANASNVTLTQAQRQRMTLYTIAPSSFHKAVDTTGVVDFDQDQATAVLAPFSGPVSRLLVAPGDLVKKGQPLATVASPDFAAAVAAYRKAIATANTDRRLADLDADMLKHHAIAPREAEQAQTDAVNAEADRDAALQALVALDVDPQVIRDVQAGKPTGRIEGTIRAPIAGTVVEKNITPGQLLQAGSTPCFTIADLSKVWVMAQLFGNDEQSVHAGDPAQVFTGDDGKPIAGTVTNVGAEVDPDTRAVTARVSVPNPQRALKKQMYVRVRIVSHEAVQGILVPVSAILRDDDNLPFVYVAESDGSFARRHVTLGIRSGDREQILSGLRAGERIVSDGGLFLRFMQSQ